jgi:hypothetical protein
LALERGILDFQVATIRCWPYAQRAASSNYVRLQHAIRRSGQGMAGQAVRPQANSTEVMRSP